MDRNNIIECGGFFFIHNFDSGNLGHVERVPTELIAPSVNHKTNTPETPDYEFNLWTRPDCAGTEFENGNRTWFYFGIQASEPAVLVRLNLINLNKQGKMYNQGMAPVTRTLPGKPQWERIRDRPVHSTDDNTFSLSFKYRTSENLKATTFFAFTYPFSFAELQIALNSIDLKMLPLPPPQSPDDIYYWRECLVHSLEGRRVDLLTITSHHGITKERETRLKNLFPDNTERPFKFLNKKVIFISARVHPGETPSSFVFNGFLNLLLTRSDPVAIALRKLYVFKMIPFLNPDGVARGHYRTDTRGVNLNRVYLNPSLIYHPTVYASRALIRYYHFGCEKEDSLEDVRSFTSRSIHNVTESSETTTSNLDAMIQKKKKPLPLGKGKPKNSTTTLKQQSSELKADSGSRAKGIGASVGNAKGVGAGGSEESTLSEQVLDMKIQEMPCQTSENMVHKTTSDSAEPSLLTDNLLRSCLGSNVHLTNSEELDIQGNNPLRPLRDTLKNSISLLLDSGGSGHTGVNAAPAWGSEQRQSSVKMGWCRECRRAAAGRETAERPRSPAAGRETAERPRSPAAGRETAERPRSPAAAGPQLSGGIISMRAESSTFRDIGEYREHQRLMLEEEASRKTNTVTHEVDSGPMEPGSVFLCTNCFKRYMVSENNEEIKLSDAMSTASVAVSADEGACDVPPNMDDNIDAVPVGAPPAKDDKPRSALATKTKPKKGQSPPAVPKIQPPKEPESGLYLYIDLHGHASKKGIFMYGNHFEEVESSVECMLLPRIMSLNNFHFHFSSCNFTERNMYLKDRRDGMSREGSGRVAVLKATGLVRSYTLECNYNTGRLVNALPPTAREGPAAPVANPPTVTPPKYTPHIFEEMRMSRLKNMEYLGEMNPAQVGRSLGASILDLTGQHPNSRIPCSEHRNINSLREWLRSHTRSTRPQLTMSRLRPKTASPSRVPTYARSKAKVTDERKENAYGAKPEEQKRAHSVFAARSGHEIISMNVSVKHGLPVPVKSTTSRTRYLSDEPKTKSLTQKRRNILSIRKPNSGKSTGGVVKAKVTRRSADDTETPRTSVISAKLGKRSFTRQPRGVARDIPRCRGATASSSSDDMMGHGGNWEDVAGGTALGSQHGLQESATVAGKRRPFPPPPPPPPARLKKIRLKTGL